MKKYIVHKLNLDNIDTDDEEILLNQMYQNGYELIGSPVVYNKKLVFYFKIN